MRTMWNENEIKFIMENYKTMTYKEMAKKINRTENAVKLKVSKLGLKKSKYIYDVDYFKKIDTIEKAYWLGFIYADGYVSVGKQNYEFGIELQGSDYKHLKKFNKAIN